MKIIMVEKQGLLEDFTAWGVAPNYARFFLSKCQEVDGHIALEPFVFNDTMHLTCPRQWFAAHTAFWCRAYREAESSTAQAEMLSAIRTLFFIAGMLGQGSITTQILQWWDATFEIHQLPWINHAVADKAISNLH